MNGLKAVNGDEVIRSRAIKGKPTFGICVGMQILFERGLEHGSFDGVGVLQGSVEKMSAPVLPHMGWNTIRIVGKSELFNGIESESFYFVHSYAVKEPVSQIPTFSNYGEDFLAAVEDGVIAATQFHPEKSGEAGLHLIKNWVQTL